MPRSVLTRGVHCLHILQKIYKFSPRPKYPRAPAKTGFSTGFLPECQKVGNASHPHLCHVKRLTPFCSCNAQIFLIYRKHESNIVSYTSLAEQNLARYLVWLRFCQRKGGHLVWKILCITGWLYLCTQGKCFTFFTFSAPELLAFPHK